MTWIIGRLIGALLIGFACRPLSDVIGFWPAFMLGAGIFTYTISAVEGSR